MAAFATFDVAIADAIRVRPNATALALLWVHCDMLEDLADTREEKIEAAGLRVLLEMNDKIGKALALGDAKSALPVAPGA